MISLIILGIYIYKSNIILYMYIFLSNTEGMFMVMFKGVSIGKINVHVFVSANIIMLLAENPNNLQQILK